jgi:Cft2 family RNA processing exonuclease
MVIQTVNQQGNVLIPVDSAGRVIEVFTIFSSDNHVLFHDLNLLIVDFGCFCHQLLLMLHQYWEVHHLHERYDLIFLSSTAPAALDSVRSMIEWSSEACIKHFDTQRDNPFAFKSVLPAHSLSPSHFLRSDGFGH